MVFSNPRMLPMQHMAKTIRDRQNRRGPDPPLLGPDEMQLYSYYRPGLVAGQYEVSVVQDIKATLATSPVKQQTLRVTNVRKNGQPVEVEDPQRFNVVVPRFTLDPNLINSYYPTDGHQDEGRVLPHLVLNDPHFPWEIDAGRTTDMSGPINGGRNIVPWVALVVFDPEELHLPSMDDITDLNVPGVERVEQQNVKGTFSMAVSDYFSSVTESSRINAEDGYGKNSDLFNEVTTSTDVAQVIFPTKKVFNDIFNNCESMKYMAHVRNINTVGFPDAGIEQLGLYSVVVSSRTGRFDITQPTTQVCHLVSIENFDSTLPGVQSWLEDPNATGSDRIGIFSLYSWVYTALPPDPVNFVDTVENLVSHQQMFRPDQPTLHAMGTSIDGMDPDSTKAKASRVLLDRLSAGYTFARWRAETGEETAAVNRGPLVPLRQPATPASDLPDHSNTSKEFQILDKATGLMDLSYANAWQLGKMLAIADSTFNAAMLRFRSTLHNTTAGATRASLNNMKPKAELFRTISNCVKQVNNISCGPPCRPKRICCDLPPTPVCDVIDCDAKPLFTQNLKANVAVRASAGSTQFNGLNSEPANDDDWVIIHNWMADKLFFSDIPPHYLIPEPSFIPAEGLRFFYIDDFWVDCLLDGALSVANHLDHDDDLLRTEVKRRFNAYLRDEVPGTGIKPQIPCYGFILRSKLVKTMPDMRITVNWKESDPEGQVRHPVCRYTKYDDTTLICLLDRQPEELDSIVLAQPPHQQRFSLGYSLTPDHLEFKLRKLYTSDAPDGEWEVLDDAKQPTEEQVESWFNWDTRCIQLETMMQDMNDLLQRPENLTSPDGAYEDDEPNSCALGIELNDPSYYFVIRPPRNSDDGGPVVPRDRQLYINDSAPIVLSSAAPIPTRSLELATASSSAARVMDIAQPAPVPTPTPAATEHESTPVAETSPVQLTPPHMEGKTQPFPASLMARRNGPSPRPGLMMARVASLASTSAPGDIQLQSQFTLNIYADYKPFPKPKTRDGFDPNAYLPTQNIFFYDLIFSLRKTLSTSAYPLLEIQIDIPTTGLDEGGRDPDKEPLVNKGYAGPGARMLSNQRFVPLVYTDVEHLRIRLVPRTAGDDYEFALNDDKSRELSFRLAEADVSSVRAGQYVAIQGRPGNPQWRGVAKCTMVEIYAAGPTGTFPVTSTVEVVKWGHRDDEDRDLEESEKGDLVR